MKKEKAKQTEKITKNMTFAEIMARYPETMPVFLEHGMSCFGCPMAMNETIEQGATAHGINAEKLIKEINSSVKKSKK